MIHIEEVPPPTHKGWASFVRWVVFVPAGLACGLVASFILYYVSFFILRLALFFLPAWCINGFATFVSGWSFGGVSVGAAAFIAPAQRKVVAIYLAVVLVLMALGVFVFGVHSDNAMVWVSAIGQAIGACVAAGHLNSAVDNLD